MNQVNSTTEHGFSGPEKNVGNKKPRMDGGNGSRIGTASVEQAV